MSARAFALAALLVACTGGSDPAPSSSSSTSSSSGTTVGSSSSGADTVDDDAAVGCTPEAYVYCRCADRSEGTKQCAQDGKSFSPCACAAP